MPPSASTADRELLRAVTTPQLLRKLDRLRFAAQHSVTERPGNTRVARATQASGLELASHKPYAAGDDLRYLDWNAYARLDQQLIKTFPAERESPVHLLLDASASMAVPAEDGKFAFAAALAVGLAYIALRQSNPVRLVVLGSDGTSRMSALARHIHRLPELVAFLTPIEPAGPTRLQDGVAAYLRATHLPGTVVVLSDFLVEPPRYEEAFDGLRGRGHHVVALRIIGAAERDPAALPRQVRLRDAETGTERIIDLTAAHRESYRRAVDEHLAQLKRWCERRAIAYATADTSHGLERCLLTDLTRAGILH